MVESETRSGWRRANTIDGGAPTRYWSRRARWCNGRPGRAPVGRRPSQRPDLGGNPAGPADRRSRGAGTRVGGLCRPRPGALVPSETSRNGARASAWRGASGSARTCAIQPSRGVLDCMAKTQHQTAYRTVKASIVKPLRRQDQSKTAVTVSSGASRGYRPCARKKTGPGAIPGPGHTF